MLTNNANYANNSFLHNYNNGLISSAVRATNDTNTGKSKQDSANFSQILESAKTETQKQEQEATSLNFEAALEAEGIRKSPYSGWFLSFKQEMKSVGLGDMAAEMIEQAHSSGSEEELLNSLLKQAFNRQFDTSHLARTNNINFWENFNQIPKVKINTKEEILNELMNIFQTESMADSSSKRNKANNFNKNMLSIIEKYI